MKTLLLLLSLTAGCYQRDLANCAVSCATSSDCPDGLACNATGRCAATETTACGADTDGGTDADPDGPPVTGTIHVVARDARGLPASGVRVIAMSSADGSAIADTTTLADGTVDLPDVTGAADVTVVVTNGVGSKLTTVRSVAPETTVTFGRRRNETPSVSRTITWPTNAGAPNYFIYTSCSPTPKQVTAVNANATQSTTITLDPSCADNFDAMVVFSDGSFQQFSLFSLANTGNVTLTGSYVVFPQADANFSALPADLASVNNTFLTGAMIFRPGDPASGPTTFGPLAGGPESASALSALPAMGSAGRELYLTLHQVGDEFERLQQIAERLPVQGAYNLQVEPNMLPWISSEPVVDLGGRSISWTQLSPGALARTAGDLVVSEISYTRGSLDFTWRVIAPPSAVTGSGLDRSIALPELPGDEAFEPRATDVLEGLQHLRIYGFTSASGGAVSYGDVSPIADLAVSTAFDPFKGSDTFLTTGLGAVDLARMTVSLNKPN